jgi:GT2 family glycosyltransferase
MRAGKVHFIVVNYHGSSTLPAYLESLLAQDCSSWHMTVVDNSENLRETQRLSYFASVSESVRIIAAPRNLGYFGAANWLMSQLDAELAEWTVVSNMDVRLRDSTFVGDLLDFDGGAPVLAPSIVSMPGGRPQNPYLVTRPSVRAMRRRKLMLSNPVIGQAAGLADEAKRRLWQRDDTCADARSRPVYAPHGSVIAFHRRYFAEGGDLEHPVFLFNEEITVAEKCRRLGFTVMFEPSLRLIHDKHQATGIWRSGRLLRAQAEAAEYGYRLIASDQPAASRREAN